MINDALLRLSGTSANPNVAQTPTYTASTVWYSTYCIDLNSGTTVSGGTTTSQNRDIGEGEDLYLVLTCATAASGTSPGLTVEVIVSDDTAGTTNPLVVGTCGTLTVAQMTAGQSFVCRINPQLRTPGQRYMQVRYTNGATNALAGVTLFADVVTDIYDSRKFYAGGFVVS